MWHYYSERLLSPTDSRSVGDNALYNVTVPPKQEMVLMGRVRGALEDAHT